MTMLVAILCMLALVDVPLCSPLKLNINVNEKMKRNTKMGSNDRINRERRYADPIERASASFLDDEIAKYETTIADTVANARESISTATDQANRLQVSYRLSVLAASVFYVENVIYGKPIANFTNSDWGTIVSNLGYFCGYGAPSLVAGQLGSPDPGCGREDVLAAMDRSYVPLLSQIYSTLAMDVCTTSPSLQLQPEDRPALVRQAVLSRDRQVRAAISCLDGQGEVNTVLARVKQDYLARLEVTQMIIDMLE